MSQFSWHWEVDMCFSVPDGSNAIEINWLTIDVTISCRKQVKPGFYPKSKNGQINWLNH